MLQNKDLLPHPTQRLGAIYLLFDMYRNELSTHPFASVFVHLLVRNMKLMIGFGMIDLL